MAVDDEDTVEGDRAVCGERYISKVMHSEDLTQDRTMLTTRIQIAPNKLILMAQCLTGARGPAGPYRQER